MNPDPPRARPPAAGSIPELLAVALPMVVSQACETLMMVIDRLFLSRLGPEYMSAAMGGGLTCFTFTTFFMGLTGYANALVAQHLGAGQPRRCPVVVTQALIVTLAAWPVILLSRPAGHWLFHVSGVAAAQLGPQQAYFDLLMLGTVLGISRNALSGFFSGLGRTRVVMVSTAVSLAVNTGANYALIFGRLGLPALGIRGAAIGTLIGSAAGLGVLLGRYLSRPIREEFGVLGGFRYDRELMGKLLRLGSPPGLEFFLNLAAFNLLVLSFHSYGVDVAAAVTIAFNWDLVSFIPLVGVGIGVTSLVGRYMGAGSPDTAHRVAMSGLKISVFYSAAMVLAFTAFPGPLVGLFRPTGDSGTFAPIGGLAAFMVRLISVYVFADALAVVFGGALRGAGDTFWTMVLSVSGHWILTLAAVVLIRGMRAGPRAAWAVVVVLVLGLGLTYYLRYRAGRWRSMKVVEEPPPRPHIGCEASP